MRLARIADRLQARGMVRPARAVRLIAGTAIDAHLMRVAEAREVRTGFCGASGALLLALLDEDDYLLASFAMPVEVWSALDGAA